jgi:hypothetical protein
VLRVSAGPVHSLVVGQLAAGAAPWLQRGHVVWGTDQKKGGVLPSCAGGMAPLQAPCSAVPRCSRIALPTPRAACAAASLHDCTARFQQRPVGGQSAAPVPHGTEAGCLLAWCVRGRCLLGMLAWVSRLLPLPQRAPVAASACAAPRWNMAHLARTTPMHNPRR